jgi:hypothetical protein
MGSVGKTKIFLYRWGNGNLVEWRDLCDQLHADGAPVQGVVLTRQGRLIVEHSMGDTSWSGARNRFTGGLQHVLFPLHEAGLIRDTTTVYAGNWASVTGQRLGLVRDLLAHPEGLPVPKRLVLYHGTNSKAAEDILHLGLRAVPVDQRAWKGDRLSQHPSYRQEAVYLTVDPQQAQYYAKKAVNVARRRGSQGVKPVVLRITIPSGSIKNLRPDDDYLAKVQKSEQDVDWLESLKYMSQVAYLGSIPANWIKVAWEGVKEEQKLAGIKPTMTIPSLDDLLALMHPETLVAVRDTLEQDARQRREIRDPTEAEIVREAKRLALEQNPDLPGRIRQRRDPQDRTRALVELDQAVDNLYPEVQEALTAQRVDQAVHQGLQDRYDLAVENIQVIDGLDCFRVMTLSRDQDPTVLSPLGIFWAHEIDGAGDYFVTDHSARKSRGDVTVMYRARIDIQGVDITKTLVNNLINPQETEVQFRPGADIFVYEVLCLEGQCHDDAIVDAWRKC